MLLTPEVVFRRVEAITPEVLRRMGITALVLDVDNTLTGDGSQQLDDSVAAWRPRSKYEHKVSLGFFEPPAGRRSTKSKL